MEPSVRFGDKGDNSNSNDASYIVHELKRSVFRIRTAIEEIQLSNTDAEAKRSVVHADCDTMQAKCGIEPPKINTLLTYNKAHNEDAN